MEAMATQWLSLTGKGAYWLQESRFLFAHWNISWVNSGKYFVVQYEKND